MLVPELISGSVSSLSAVRILAGEVKHAHRKNTNCFDRRVNSGTAAETGEHGKADRDTRGSFVLRPVNGSWREFACDLGIDKPFSWILRYACRARCRRPERLPRT